MTLKSHDEDHQWTRRKFGRLQSKVLLSFIFERNFDGFLILIINRTNKKRLMKKYLSAYFLNSDSFSVGNRMYGELYVCKSGFSTLILVWDAWDNRLNSDNEYFNHLTDSWSPALLSLNHDGWVGRVQNTLAHSLSRRQYGEGASLAFRNNGTVCSPSM